ncbi:MAG: sugar ABC transporter permease [Anaerolineae bacterium]|nr:sugar ABC transporter permease [Anaerolineae bacterium]
MRQVQLMDQAPGATRTRFWRKAKDQAGWFLFIAPNVLAFLLFSLSCYVFVVYLSFQRWDLIGVRKFIGLDNFARLATDPILAKSFANIAKYVLMFVLPVSAVSLGLALLANRRIRGMYFFRSAYFLPWVTSTAVIAVIWNFALIPRGEGPLNYLLGLIGIPPQLWLVDTNLALPSLAGINIWTSAGYYMVLWLAGLQSIPETLYDAAKMDGADSWALFRHVTLPMLSTTTVFILTITIIGAFQMFGLVYTMTGGGPMYATISPVYYIWQTAFVRYHMGYASAVSLALFAVIMVATVLQRKITGWGEEMY